jgi:ferredoxin
MGLRTTHEKCSGCCTCRLACALENRRVVNPSLAVLRIEGRFPAPGDYRIHVCDQCGACADACPVEAIRVDETGVYAIEEEICTSCMLCVDACPYGVLVVNKQTSMPIKCVLCGACVEACPRDAITIV